MALLIIGKTERKLVFFTAGLPFAVVRRAGAVESALKNVWDTVLVWPTGGLPSPILKGRRAVSRGFRPFDVIEKHAILALALLIGNICLAQLYRRRNAHWELS
jgi:hypothetical protein